MIHNRILYFEIYKMYGAQSLKTLMNDTNKKYKEQGSLDFFDIGRIPQWVEPSSTNGEPSVTQNATSVTQGEPSVTQGATSVTQGEPSVTQGATQGTTQGSAMIESDDQYHFQTIGDSDNSGDELATF